MQPHAKRWITGIIAVPILFLIIAYGSERLFSLLIVLASLIGVVEYNQMVFGEGHRREKAETLAVSLLLLATVAGGNSHLFGALLTFAVTAILMLNLLTIKKEGLDTGRIGKVVLGVMYVPLLMSHFLMIRQSPSGIRWIFFILVLAFSGDIAAYYVGRGLGKRKLLPEVSPGKTVEGTIGLFAGSIIGCMVFRQFFFPSLPVLHTVIMGLVGGIAGQLGDLSESALKRAAGVKDSGMLLPGHGGILDRLDCLMFIAPFIYYYRMLIVS